MHKQYRGASCLIITCRWEKKNRECVHKITPSLGIRTYWLKKAFLQQSICFFWCLLNTAHTQAWGSNHCLRPLFKQFIHYLHTRAQVSKNNLTKALDLFQKDQGCGGLLLKLLHRENFFPWESETAQNVKLWSKLLTTFTSNTKTVISFCSQSAGVSHNSKTQKNPNIKSVQKIFSRVSFRNLILLMIYIGWKVKGKVRNAEFSCNILCVVNKVDSNEKMWFFWCVFLIAVYKLFLITK